MYRRLSILSGIAITAVILNHAGGWGLVALIWWVHRYRPVEPPNYDGIGTLPYFLSDVIHLFTVFAVPAFLFISGFFIAYAARAGKTGLGWKSLRTRIVALLIPYLIWSAYVIFQDLVLGEPLTARQIILRVLLTGANGGFFFIPVLITFYLLSPWLVELARRNWKALVIGAAAIQVIPIVFRYLRLAFGASPLLAALIAWTPDQLIIRWAIFFPLGIAAGLHMDAFKSWLSRHKKRILAALIASYVVMFIETELIFFLTPDHWRPGPSSIFFVLYSLSFILAFLAFEQVAIPFARSFIQLGTRSYGLYLTHFIIMTIVAKLTYHLLPWLLAQQFLFQALMLAVGLAAPLLFMILVARSPLRRIYPYLFG
jgi:fucose 4-O-acetylase-like acetyltransferase